MKKREINSSRMPVFRDSGFELYNAALTAETFRKELENERVPGNYIYSRYRNPTVVSAEEEVMKLEGCNWALLTQSGMSAIDTAVSIFQLADNSKPWLFFSEIYGGSISFIETILRKRRGMDVQYFTPKNGSYDIMELEKVISSMKPEFIYVESVSNPMLIVADVPSVVKIARKYGSKVILDNTFATPFLYKPLNEGVDIVIHSVTKYISGHGNISAGVICGNDDTLMHKAIEKVWFPGLQSHITHSVAASLFEGRGYGGMITFDFKAGDNEGKRVKRDNFISRVSEKILLIPTLGDPHTILMPVESVWGEKYPEPGMIRLSVGYEEYEDLQKTIADALKEV